MTILTDEEILNRDCLDLKYDAFDTADIVQETILQFARAIEAAVIERIKSRGVEGYRSKPGVMPAFIHGGWLPKGYQAEKWIPLYRIED